MYIKILLAAKLIISFFLGTILIFNFSSFLVLFWQLQVKEDYVGKLVGNWNWMTCQWPFVRLFILLGNFKKLIEWSTRFKELLRALKLGMCRKGRMILGYRFLGLKFDQIWLVEIPKSIKSSRLELFWRLCKPREVPKNYLF